VFGFGPATRIYVAAGTTDMRKGFNGLYGLVRDHLGCDPESGHVFLFARMRVATVSNFWYMTEAAFGFVRRS
jgi:transposase